jgi:hypothetical protein
MYVLLNWVDYRIIIGRTQETDLKSVVEIAKRSRAIAGFEDKQKAMSIIGRLKRRWNSLRTGLW